MLGSNSALLGLYLVIFLISFAYCTSELLNLPCVTYYTPISQRHMESRAEGQVSILYLQNKLNIILGCRAQMHNNDIGLERLN